MHYIIKTILLDTGERFPMCIDSRTGMPHYWITLYSMTQLRAKGLAVNTITQNFRHLFIILFFLEKHSYEEISLHKRFEQGKFLSSLEIQTLCELCTRSFENIAKSKNISDISSVDLATTANRMRTIRDYLVWLAKSFLSQAKSSSSYSIALEESIAFTAAEFTAKVPKFKKDSLRVHDGLTASQLSLLFSIVDKKSHTNPWKSEFLRARNELIVVWLYQFGLSRGELLNMKISDIDFKSHTFLVLKRPDDKDDPRVNQPLVQTKEKKIQIPKKIVDTTLEYILGHRGIFPESQYHEFLFIAEKSGKPLSLIALNKIFFTIKQSHQDFPHDFSPTVLKRAWSGAVSPFLGDAI